ncbi:MAG: hypothetical protein H0V79_02640 [Actinobacteria bacterium]|nr:hypothetical protein [Actinomycetota bacterium]
MRDVVPIRLGAREREQIAKTAARRELALSSFIRQAALQASAVVSGKASVVRPARAGAQGGAPATSSRQEPVSRLVVIDPAPAGHWVEGEFVSR